MKRKGIKYVIFTRHLDFLVALFTLMYMTDRVEILQTYFLFIFFVRSFVASHAVKIELNILLCYFFLERFMSKGFRRQENTLYK